MRRLTFGIKFFPLDPGQSLRRSRLGICSPFKWRINSAAICWLVTTQWSVFWRLVWSNQSSAISTRPTKSAPTLTTSPSWTFCRPAVILRYSNKWKISPTATGSGALRIGFCALGKSQANRDLWCRPVEARDGPKESVREILGLLTFNCLRLCK